MSKLLKALLSAALTIGSVALLTAAPAQATTPRSWLQASTGTFHTCAIRSDHTLYCWGGNFSGELGLGLGPSATALSPTKIGTGTWSQVSAGSAGTCAITTTHKLYCWGGNAHGEIGNGSTVGRTTPRRVGTSSAWSRVSSGSQHVCALNTTHKLYCWGYNANGELGDGTQTDRLTPKHIGSVLWSSVTAGNLHTCGVTTAHKLYCWGYNGTGQLGLHDTTDRKSPRRVGALADWSNVSAAANHSCAVRSNHTAYCWGYNNNGAIGDGTTSIRLTPTRLSSEFDADRWGQITAGAGASCAIQTNHRLGCWGYNGHGELGNGTTTTSLVPLQESHHYSDWASVTGGFNYACGLRSTKHLYCWGSNNEGELGNGGTSPTSTATLVN
ncbi:MAG: bnr repeat-containing protein [Aeromicrobium sp.]|nr:bnr repeat-containing protein [Aeromicrobium sp.]